MTAQFQVYVEGSRDPSPTAVSRLAAGIGQKYGLPPADIEARLMRGRFRVKANADRATAAQYVRELEALGAVCTVVDASGATVDVVAMPAPSARSLPKPSGAPRAASALPPSAAPRPASAALPPAPPRAANAPTGLAAAASGASADLGVLGRDDGSIALASLDGADEPLIEPTSHASKSFAPPGKATVGKGPASPAPPAPTAKPAMAPREIDADAFAAPDDDAEMELALDVVAEKQKKASTPVPVIAAPAGPPASASGKRDSRPALAGAPAAATAAPRAAMPPIGDVVRARLADVRIRFAAGVLAAVLIGFLPACIVGTMKQNAAFTEVDQKLDGQQRAATTLDEYETLDRTRALALERKYSERTNAAITAFLIWAVAGAAVAYVWFRRVPWDRLTARPGAGAG